MIVQKYHPIWDTPAELLYNIVWAGILSKCPHIQTARPIIPTMEAWVAFLDGKPVAVQVVIPEPNSDQVQQIISWTSPQHRGQGIFKKLNDEVDADLSARGYTHYISYVIAPEKEMLQAVLSRGGEIIEYKCRRPVYSQKQ